MIEPALTAEEWESPRAYIVVDGEAVLDCVSVAQLQNESTDITALIAVANAALPDDGPRKITRAWVDELRYVAHELENDALSRIADALESYLPPE